MIPRITIKGISKRFAAPVLRSVQLNLGAGKIHGLIGENGAGKSTLINIISGLLPPDEGSLQINGLPFTPKTRRHALDSGIALASQELSLIENLSVAENVFLAHLPQTVLTIDTEMTHLKTRELLQALGTENIYPQTTIASLSLAQKQQVELAKALSMAEANCQLLIMDEPTSALTEFQAAQLHNILKKRAGNGLSILYVSHRLEDVLNVCDEVSVLREGAIQLTAQSGSLSSEGLIKLISGDEFFETSIGSRSDKGPLRLRVKEFSSDIFPESISLECYRAEILGIAGLAGSGRSELLHSMFGLAEILTGTVNFYDDGRSIEIRSVEDAVAHGFALVPEDRKTQGIFRTKSIAMNITAAGLSRLGSVLSAVLPKREIAVSEELIDRLKVKCEGPLQQIESLSGGNQQKVMLARWMEHVASIWLLDEPTRGVDVAAKLAIHNQLRELRDEGAAMIIVSNELEELTALCDRILVLSKKRHVATFERGEWNKESLLKAAFSGYLGKIND